jgi:hypothetical protein
MNVTGLISSAFYLSAIVSREFETVSGSQMEEGLSVLNEILSVQNIGPATIPYYGNFSFTGIIGQEKYTVPNLISVDAITFNLSNVRYNLRALDRSRYFGMSRVDNINSLPSYYFFDRQLGVGEIYVYYLPASDYEFNINGKFALQSVTLDQDLSTTLDPFYIRYLRYYLAKSLCSEYQDEVPRGVLQELSLLNKKIKYFSGVDLVSNFPNPFGGTAMNPIEAQLYTGYTPQR